MKHKLLKLSLYLLIIAVAVLVISYFFYHFVTDSGISLEFHKEPEKPFVAELIADLGVLCLFGSLASLLSAFIIFGDKE